MGHYPFFRNVDLDHLFLANKNFNAGGSRIDVQESVAGALAKGPKIRGCLGFRRDYSHDFSPLQTFERAAQFQHRPGAIEPAGIDRQVESWLMGIVPAAL